MDEIRSSNAYGPCGETGSHVALAPAEAWYPPGGQAQAFLAAIVENSDDAIAAYTPAGILLTWNRGAEAVFGYSAGEAIGMSAYLLAEVPAGLNRFSVRILEGHTVSQYEGLCRRKDGRTFPVSATGSPITNKSGEVIAISVILRDITERRETERKLEESEKRFREVFEHAPLGMCLVGPDERFLQVNEAFCRMLGYSERELLEAGWEAVTHPDDLASSWQRVRQMREEPCGLLDAEKRYIHRSGEVVWARMKRTAVQDAAGIPLYFVVHVEDISEARRAAEAVRLSEARLRGITESAPDAILMMDPRGAISYWNPAAESILGYSRDEAIGKHLHQLLAPQRFHAAQCAASPEFARSGCGDGIGRTIEQLARRKDGSEIAVDLSLSSISLNGEWHAIGMIRDITARKRATDDLQESNRHLAIEMDRASELAVRAEAANEAKSRFLANMSHEIRTPMNGVIGMLQLLRLTGLTAEQREYATIAQDSGATLLALIDDILDLSKIEARKLVLENLSFNLRRSVEEVVRGLSIQASAKGLLLAAQVAPGIPELLVGDARRLRQVLTNLCGNAVKFTERGSVTLNVELEPGSRSNGAEAVRFTVSDTGIGIRQAQLGELFAPFVQADASTTRRHGGTGLGLAICKQLVALMGGTIGVESREGKGSSFRFNAVFERAAPSRPQPANTPGSDRANADGEPANDRRTGRILVAEDNETNRLVALAQLEHLGYRASAVVNGAEAVEAVNRGEFDLVLMDCHMPVMDGFEATLGIRGSSQAGIPIIAVTADAMPADRDRCLRGGFDDYLAKPVDLTQLASALAKWMPSHRSEGVAQTALPTPATRPTDLFDAEGLLERLMGDRQLAARVLKTFIQDAPSQLDNLRKRLEEQDAPGARCQAHALKGAAATAAADDLAAIASALERAGSAGQLQQCAGLLSSAHQEFERFKSTLAQAGWV